MFWVFEDVEVARVGRGSRVVLAVIDEIREFRL